MYEYGLQFGFVVIVMNFQRAPTDSHSHPFTLILQIFCTKYFYLFAYIHMQIGLYGTYLVNTYIFFYIFQILISSHLRYTLLIVSTFMPAANKYSQYFSAVHKVKQIIIDWQVCKYVCKYDYSFLLYLNIFYMYLFC